MTPAPANNVPEIRTMHGLYLQPNTFNIPDGALEVAENIVVKNDQTLSSRRGYYEFFDPPAGTLNNLFLYEDKLLAVYTNKIRYYTDTGSAPNIVGSEGSITGESFTISDTSRELQANSNLYFTTDDGMLKLTAYNSILSKSGAPPALDLETDYANTETATWFEGGNIVGYRYVFGYTDDNDNLILSAPSQISTITNPEFTTQNYTSAGGGPWTVTVTTTGHNLVTGDVILVTDATDTDANGTFSVTVTSSTQFTYSVVGSDPTNGTLTWTRAMPVRLEGSIPSEITTALPWFRRIYRSSQQLISTGIFSDFQLISEEMLTSAEISARLFFFDDDVDDILRGTELYTNENSGEGEQQANFRAPVCLDVTYFKNFAMYANCTTRHYLNLSMVDPTQLANNDYVEIKVDAVTRRYVARYSAGGVGNRTVVGTCSSSAGLLITYTAHGLQNGDTIYISNIVGGTLAAGTYYVINQAANTFKISLTSGGAAIAYNGETSLSFEGVTNGTYPIFYVSDSSSAAVRLQATATYLMKAINRDPSSVVYGEYISGINDVPGLMRIQAKGFGDPIYMRANTLTAGTAFSPALPDSFLSGTQVFSQNQSFPHCIFISKLGEPEAVPLVNFLPAGSRNYPILRVKALRDSVIIVKGDGVYRLTGDSRNNFNITILDSTVICVASSSLSVLNNQVNFLSNQGVCMVSESSVQIISRAKIEDVIQPILGQPNLASQTGGMGYETERLYLLSTTEPNDTTKSITYAYNVLTNEWTTWDTLFVQAIVGPEDRMYFISTDNRIFRERKDQVATDYSDQNYAITIDDISDDLTEIEMTVIDGTPRDGDMIVKDDVISWILGDPVFLGGNSYLCTVSDQNNLEVGDSLELYSAFYHRIKFSPFHGGLLSKMKLFTQFQLHLRNNSMSAALFSFTGYALGGSGVVEWESQLTFEGWGNFPWGFEPWGQSNAIDLQIGTTPAPVVRILVPALQARNTFIQVELEHHKAGEPLNIQAISYVVRGYKERTTR